MWKSHLGYSSTNDETGKWNGRMVNLASLDLRRVFLDGWMDQEGTLYGSKLLTHRDQ